MTRVGATVNVHDSTLLARRTPETYGREPCLAGA